MSLKEATAITYAAKSNILTIILKQMKNRYGPEIYEDLEKRGFNRRWIDKIMQGTHSSSIEKFTELSEALFMIDKELFMNTIMELKERRKKVLSLFN